MDVELPGQVKIRAIFTHSINFTSPFYYEFEIITIFLLLQLVRPFSLVALFSVHIQSRTLRNGKRFKVQNSLSQAFRT